MPETLSTSASQPEPATAPPRPPWAGLGVVVRVVLLALLGGLLLVPLMMIGDLVGERADRLHGVEADLAAQWGGEQVLGGPVLLLPYRLPATAGEAAGETRWLHLLPERLEVSAEIVPELRRKSIYDVLLYGSRIRLSARFEAADLAARGVPAAAVLWDEASLVLGFGDARGVRALAVSLDDRPLRLLPGTPKGALFPVGVHARLGDAGPAAHVVAAELSLDGVRALTVLPMGSETSIAMRSAWPHPDFVGGFLPAERTVTPDGFAARWTVSALARAYPQGWVSDEIDFARIDNGAVGVRLVLPGDFYQQIDRVTKYGVLVVALTLGAVFLIGVLQGGRAHFVQYVLIGAALCLFYLLLLSLAEHVGFAWAYLAAALATIAMVALYLGATVRRRAGWLIAGELAIVHGYVYVLLGLEDYALLAGTVGLFVMLAAIMLLTRRIDWWSLEARPA
jgi:inner membrane protein